VALVHCFVKIELEEGSTPQRKWIPLRSFVSCSQHESTVGKD